MSQFVLILAFLGGVGGGISLFETMFRAASAPQQAAGAAIAVALAVIPYVMARSVQLTIEASRRREHESRVIDRLDSLERALDRKSNRPSES